MYNAILKYTIRITGIVVIAMVSVYTSNAQTIFDIPKEITNYERSMKEVINSTASVSLENTLNILDVLISREGDAYTLSWLKMLQSFDAITFENIKTLLIGFWVNRDEIIFTEPNPAFFAKLAREKGTDVDRAFFNNLQKTYPDGVFPVYIKQYSDWGGCTVFDGETISEIYGIWVKFQKDYPDRYQIRVRGQLKKIEDNIMGSCICGEENAYWNELQYFVKKYPDSPITKNVSSRVEKTDKNASYIRFQCEGGR